jgi:hypothetical protein
MTSVTLEPGWHEIFNCIHIQVSGSPYGTHPEDKIDGKLRRLIAASLELLFWVEHPGSHGTALRNYLWKCFEKYSMTSAACEP